MAFVLLVCAEVRNEKINLEFPFDGRPTLPDLNELIERVFRFEASNAVQTSSAHSRDSIEPIFTIAKVQLYVDESRQWADLTSPTQLHMYDQLFVLRKYLSPSDNGRREIPRPRTSMYFSGRAVPVAPTSGGAPGLTSTNTPRLLDSPAAGGGGGALLGTPAGTTPRGAQQLRSARTNGTSAAGFDDDVRASRSHVGGVLSQTAGQHLLESGAASQQEMVRIVFEAADKRRHGVITNYDLSLLFRTLQVQLEPSAIEEIFGVYAQSGNGRNASDTVMSLKDFSVWASNYEATVAACFHRIISIEKEHRLSDAQQDSATKMAQMMRQKAEMEDALRRLEGDIARENDRKRSLDEEMEELLQERLVDTQEDQIVVDKEVRVQHHRLILRQEEEDFAQIAIRRRVQQGGPAAVAGVTTGAGAGGVSRSYSSQSTPGRTASYGGTR